LGRVDASSWYDYELKDLPKLAYLLSDSSSSPQQGISPTALYYGSLGKGRTNQDELVNISLQSSTAPFDSSIRATNMDSMRWFPTLLCSGYYRIAPTITETLSSGATR
jgi:hypothetical protein